MSDNKDDFWDISSLLPPKKKKPASPFVKSVPVSEVALSQDPSKRGDDSQNRALHFFAENGEAESKEYIPSWNPLLRNVRIRLLKSNYRFYRVFREDSVRLLHETADACPFVPFFSYIPQYAQMNKAQLSYYLYFRAEARCGRYIDTNQSYFLLYVYEILNLPEYIPPKEGIVQLANAWAAYRKILPNLEKNMVRWISDYALVHEVACPNDVFAPFLPDVLSVSHLKEFYLGNGTDFTECHLNAFLALASEYNYQNGRYVQGENGDLFLTHIPRAVDRVLASVLERELDGVLYQTVTKEYEAYQGALCAEEYKYSIAITYCSVSGTEALKHLMTSVVKYAENKVRAYLSIKSRLSVAGLPQRYKDILDAYFAEALVRTPKREVIIRPEYEALYDAPSIGISDEEAQKIENSSWQNTIMLIPEEEREELLQKSEASMPNASPKADTDDGLAFADVKILSLLFDGDEDAARAYAAETGLVFESACERINEYFSDTMGDIIMEIGEDGVALLEDYETEVGTFLSSRVKNE